MSTMPCLHRLRIGLRAGAATLGIVLAALAALVFPASRALADTTFDQHLLDLVNRDRAANGLLPLVADPTLGGTAEGAPYTGCGFPVAGRAVDMGQRNYFSHTILGCGTQGVFNLLQATGLLYASAGENLAWMNGSTDPLVAAENVHSQLMNSPAHRANILNPLFTAVGVGSWHTSAGQTWSGGGVSLANVYIGVEVFATLPSPPADPPGRFTPLTPSRILDTRDGTGGIRGPVGPGATIDVPVTGVGGVPVADVVAVAVDLTVTQSTDAGYLTAWPSGTARPSASDLNFGAGENVSNLAVVKVGANGKVSVFNASGGAQVVVDVAGWYSGTATGSAGRFQPVVPARILDTRIGLGGARLGPGATLDLQVAGAGGVPSSGVQAAVVNVTATNPTSATWLTVYPAGEARPNASNLNVAAGGTVAARAAVKLGAGGKVTVANALGAADVIVDVNGWYTDATVLGTLGAYVPLAPARILDTRDGTGSAGAVAAGGTVDVQVTGRGGVPAAGVRAVVFNATVTQPAGPGFLTIFPAGAVRPGTSDLNYGAGATQADLVVVQVGTDGKVSVASSATTHVIFDIAGWIS